MKHELTLWYSVQNGGDGSAYPHFMESEKLAEWDQEHLCEGWGESCTGSITLYSDSPITTDKDIKTTLEYLVGMYQDDRDEDIDDFVKEFFPNGTPKMDVEIEELKHTSEYVYNIIKVDGKQVGKVFLDKKDSGKPFEELINKYTVKTLPNNTSMTTTTSLSAEQVKDKILHCKGQFIKVKWQSDPKPAASFKAFNLKKITEGVCRAGIDYSQLGVVKEGIESGERGEVQPLPFGSWVKFPYIIGHTLKDKDGNPGEYQEYIRLYPSNHIPKSLFYVNDELVSKEEFAKYLTASDAKKLLSPTEEAPLCFTIKSSNILSIPEEVEV